MGDVDWLAVHQGAPADDALGLMRGALPDRSIRHATLPEGAMKPEAGYPPPGRLAHHLD